MCLLHTAKPHPCTCFYIKFSCHLQLLLFFLIWLYWLKAVQETQQHNVNIELTDSFCNSLWSSTVNISRESLQWGWKWFCCLRGGKTFCKVWILTLHLGVKNISPFSGAVVFCTLNKSVTAFLHQGNHVYWKECIDYTTWCLEMAKRSKDAKTAACVNQVSVGGYWRKCS